MENGHGRIHVGKEEIDAAVNHLLGQDIRVATAHGRRGGGVEVERAVWGVTLDFVRQVCLTLGFSKF